MRFRFSSTHILLLFLAGLSAWYFLYENRYKPAQKEVKAQEESLLPFSKEAITELIISNKNEPKFHLKKGAQEEWLLIEPVADKADSLIVNQLLSSLSSSKKERTFEDVPQDLSPFGLDQPQVKIRVLKDLENQVEILLGNQTQVGSWIYAQLASDSKVIKTSKSLLTSFQKNLFDLRNKNLVSLKRDTVTEVEFEFAGKKLLFVKNSSQGNWQLGRLAAPVDSNEWSKVESKIFSLAAKAVVAETPDPELLAAFQSPRLILRLKKGAETPSEIVREKILFVQRGEKTLARVDGRFPVYEVNQGIIQDLSQTENHYRDQHLLSLEDSAVSRIKISHQGKKFEIFKDQEKWRFNPDTPENKEEVDPEKVGSFLRATKDLKAQEFLSNQATLNTTSVIEWMDSQEKVLGKVELGPLSKDWVRGKSSYQPSPWTLSKKNYQSLNLTKESFVKQKEKPNDSVTH